TNEVRSKEGKHHNNAGNALDWRIADLEAQTAPHDIIRQKDGKMSFDWRTRPVSSRWVQQNIGPIYSWLQATAWILCCIGGSRIGTSESPPCLQYTLDLLNILLRIGDSAVNREFL
ncbi:hypothetical protein HAX54_033272, partial [Datura stramonium]|nr:hypothetical protein [Datura stramonium]